jgi:hypothetical protein
LVGEERKVFYRSSVWRLALAGVKTVIGEAVNLIVALWSAGLHHGTGTVRMSISSDDDGIIDVWRVGSMLKIRFLSGSSGR